MICCNSDYKKLLEKICKEGNDVKNTYELLGTKVDVMLSDTKTVKEIFNISDEFESEFVESICKFIPKAIGPYITEKYFLLIPELKAAVDQLKNDCNETRRAVITFPKEHCFQSIQFLVRENTINVVCFMRSCDAVKNLPCDAWLCYKLADMFAYYMNETLKESPYKCHKLTMMFGSLHVYKEDILDVL